MADSKWYLVGYDVRDPDRLRKTAKHLEGYGERVQYSIFRCWMSKLEMERLRWELTEILTGEDDIMIIPLCSHCVAGIVGIHGEDNPPDWPSQPARHKIV